MYKYSVDHPERLNDNELKQVTAIGRTLLNKVAFSTMFNTLAHIVWDDENWDSVQWCIDNYNRDDYPEHNEEELNLVLQSMFKLLEVLEEEDVV